MFNLNKLPHVKYNTFLETSVNVYYDNFLYFLWPKTKCFSWIVRNCICSFIFYAFTLNIANVTYIRRKTKITFYCTPLELLSFVYRNGYCFMVFKIKTMRWTSSGLFAQWLKKYAFYPHWRIEWQSTLRTLSIH